MALSKNGYHFEKASPKRPLSLHRGSMQIPEQSRTLSFLIFLVKCEKQIVQIDWFITLYILNSW